LHLAEAGYNKTQTRRKEKQVAVHPAASGGVWAVELDQVTKAFGDVIAVDEMSLGIRDGEFFSLLGPSGCGKTTTLRMIAGFEEPTVGDVYIKGQAMTGIPAYRRPVNTVFQSYALFPHMSVGENIAFGLEMKKVPKAERARRVDEALELVQLPGLGERRPKQLSGGQQQRVALARALVNRPQVLLLDEPLGALDLKLRKAMQLELKRIQSEVGITFIYVTHDQEEALTMSDRIAVMNFGLVQQVGEPKAIYEHPANRFVADFIGETNFVEGSLLEIGAPATVRIGSLDVLAMMGDHRIVPGQSVTLAVRPEKLDLYPATNGPLDKHWFDAAEFDQRFGTPDSGLVRHQMEDAPPEMNVVVPGRVDEAIYIGTDTRYQVSLGDGLQLFVRIQNFGARYDIEYGPGDPVYVHWLADNAQVLIE
jgi:spermidine/putrescine transport system ATP-binding protein